MRSANLLLLKQMYFRSCTLSSTLMAFLWVISFSCSKQISSQYRGRQWNEADKLFRENKYWLGGDGAYSIDLKDGRVLWLFADSIVDPEGMGSRHGDRVEMINNCVAIQKGYDPSTASIEFFWQNNENNQPTAFFPGVDGDWYWPGHGIRLDDCLIIFLMKVKAISTGIGFEVHDWDAVLIQNPDSPPSKWEIERLDSPDNWLQVIVGSASVLAEDDYVYAYSTREPHGGDVYLVRWRKDDLYEGNLQNMKWWAGDNNWIAWSKTKIEPIPVLKEAHTEFTVHYDRELGRYFQIQHVGFGSAVLTMRTSEKLTGPWSQMDTLYKPPETIKPNIMIYQAKAHPYLIGSDLVLTYSTNSFDFGELLIDSTIYYPRFVRMSTDDK